MKQCIIIVFDNPTFADRVEDVNIEASDIKEICDFDDRWETFNKYLNEEYKNLDLCRDSDGLVYDEINYAVYGLILVR